jgi:hypothetical protein
MTAWQPFDLETELAQSFLCEVDLQVFKGIFFAAAHQEWELLAIGREEVAEIEAIALRFVISHEARCGGEVECNGPRSLGPMFSRYYPASFAGCFPSGMTDRV